MGRDGSRRRYRLAIAAATLVVALAGCSAVLPGTGESAAYTTSGDELNGTTLSEDHADQLESAGSYTTRTTLDVESTNQSALIESTTRVDLTGDRALRTSAITTDLLGGGELRTDTFTAAEETYRRLRVGSGDQAQVRYSHASAPYEDDAGLLGTTPVNVTEATNARLARTAADAIDWTQTGTVERNGTTLTRYEASGSENFSDFRNETALGSTGANLTELDANVTGLTAVMFVDRHGLVAEFRFELTGTAGDEDVSLSFEVLTTDVGETTVEDPDWLAEARERA